MNKLGFYIENTTVSFLRDALREVKPPTILIHAGDRGLLREIRQSLSPDSFVIGRLFVDLGQQTAWLDSPDPAARGRELADRIINYDFGLASERGANGRLLIDAWMSLNEVLPGPASFPGYQVSAEYRRRAAALDLFQVAFLDRLHSRGLEGVAFNFAAGNYTRPEHYLDWFPDSLAAYKYLGFHEYGWPTLYEDSSRGTATAALFYRGIMEEVRNRYGEQHRSVITEAGLARMYKYPHDGAGDVGWLYSGETISEEDYWQSLLWYNNEIAQDEYMLGACLFQVGHAGRWETFRHLGQDNQQRPILLMSKIAALNTGTVPPEPPEPPEPPSPDPDLPELQRRISQQITVLEAAQQSIASYTGQVTRLTATLDSLVATATQVSSLPQDLSRLLDRLDDVDAQVQQLLAQGEISNSQAEAFQQRSADLRNDIAAQQSAADQAATLSDQVRQAQQQLAPLVAGAQQAAAVQQRVTDLLAEAHRLAVEAGLPAGHIAQPAVDSRPVAPARAPRGILPHPKPSGEYPTRPVEDIRRIIVHHTMTSSDITVEQLAQMYTQRGLPGIGYHFLVNGDGTSHWTQPLEALLPQTNIPSIDAESVAVALAGDFSNTIPGALQIQGAAKTIAWLLTQLRLGLDSINGRSELDSSVISPGSQWLQGVEYKQKLLDAIENIVRHTPYPGQP
jgi:hypothetical protein